MARQTFSPRHVRLPGRLLRVLTSRYEALRFLPETTDRIAELLRDAGFRPRDDAGFAACLPLRHDEIVRKAALAGTPPHGAITLEMDGFERLTRLRSWDRRPVARLLSSLINAHIATHRSCLGDPAFWTRALDVLRRVGAPYLVIGDSHSLCSCIVGGSVRHPAIPIHILCTAGSAAGLDNPSSRSGYGSELSCLAAALRELGGGTPPILLQFGQVDIEFVSVYQRISRAESVFDRPRFDAFCDRTVEAYGSFLSEAFHGVGTPHVLSIFPPALADEAWAEGYNNAHVSRLEARCDADEMTAMIRAINIPTLAERTVLHRRFNERLAAMCRERSLIFEDLYDSFIGPGGTIATRFNRSSRGRDHHICAAAARKVIRPVIERIALREHG